MLAYARRYAFSFLRDRSSLHSERHARLYRNGRNQALRIPHELELAADEAIVRKDGDSLIGKPIRRRPDLATLLAGWEPIDEIFPGVDEGPLPLDDIQL
jgi:antitoxin VapB